MRASFLPYLKKLFEQKWLIFSFWIYLCLMGLVLVFLVPPFQKSDEDFHYYHAYSLLYGGCNFDTPTGSMRFPTQIYNYPQTLENNRIFSGYDQKVSAQTFQTRQLQSNSDFKTLYRPCVKFGSLAYLPSIIGLLIGGKNLLLSFYLARLMGLIVFLITIWASFKLAGEYSPLIMAVAMLPMLIHQVTAISYDSMHLSLGILAFASFIYLKNQPQKLSLKRLGIFLSLLLSFSLVKRGYYLALGLPLILIWPSLIKKINWGWLNLLVGFYLLTGWLSFYSVTKMENIKYSGFDADWQQIELQRHPTKFLKIVADTTVQKFNFYFISLYGNFGYIDYQLHFSVYLGLILMTIFLLSQIKLEPKPTTTSDKLELIILAGMILGTYFLILLAMYLHSTVVGASIIEGVQGRYLLIPYLWSLYFCVRLTQVIDQKKLTQLGWGIALGLIIWSLAQSVYFRYYDDSAQINPINLETYSRMPGTS